MPKVLLSSLVVVCLLCHWGLANPIEEPNSPAVQDPMAFLDSVQNRELGSSRLRDLATLYEVLVAGGLSRERADMEDQAINLNDQDYPKDKRASYMSLCHFKICNMGRKRNSYWNGWSRT